MDGAVGFGATQYVAIKRLAKRALDLTGSFILIVFFMPHMSLIAVLVKIADGGPILFAQTRIGRNGQRFKCLKFRTMVVHAEEALKTYFDGCPDARREWIETQKLRVD